MTATAEKTDKATKKDTTGRVVRVTGPVVVARSTVTDWSAAAAGPVGTAKAVISKPPASKARTARGKGYMGDHPSFIGAAGAGGGPRRIW